MSWPILSPKNGKLILVMIQIIELLQTALEKGFIYIDAANSYEAEREVAIAIKESGIPRDKLFITTKVLEGWKDVPVALDGGFKRLQVDYVDMYESLIYDPS
ncbi:hypothetical protein PCG10_003092 [Penicillium crustosum]|uniref:NADP-dependent oxidoreductase domain-containing protein n=1 Tax=Penicillium crustosum TaxID=36656 RepID=A0A9P5GRI6_PENCR|nr:hypothetical protein PCG10_003092 [Penicillium crustosum]